jgi:membrane-associated phospholipid phosphatase
MRQRLTGLVLVSAMLLCILATGGTARAGDAVQTAGDVVTVVLPVAAVGMILGLKDYDGALQLAESGLLTAGVTFGLKYTVDERRPNGERYSFPSAHTSASFASAEYLRKRYGWELGIPAYALASFVAFSRVDSDQHYAHDVIAGAAIGIASSYLFTKEYRGWRLKAEADPGYYGVRLSRSW